MLRRMLEYFERELQHVRGSAGEFAADFPKIAERVGLDKFKCQDPYVDRLLEGLAYLSARVQFKLDSEFPRFTQGLFETVLPQYLSPTPSMAIVQFQPDLADGSLAEGRVVPRDTSLKARSAKNEQTGCEYRTSDAVRLLPLTLEQAAYHTQDLPSLGLPAQATPVRAALRLRLNATAGLTFDAIRLDSLRLHIRGAEGQAMRIYEQLLAQARAIVVRPAARPVKDQRVVPGPGAVRRVGFETHQAVLPVCTRTFEGYRLLREYFAFPERFMFVDLCGLDEASRAFETAELDLFVLLRQADPQLENAISAANFALHACPAINLFRKRCDRIPVTDRLPEFRVDPDRTLPVDFEVYQVDEVEGYSTGVEKLQDFRPFYRATDLDDRSAQAYFTVHRRPRTLTTKQKLGGHRTAYPGTEVWIALTDAQGAPYRPELRELGVSAWCTNRDLPLDMPVGQGASDFTVEGGMKVRCLGMPRPPRPSYAEGDFAWRLVSHLSVNYLTLVDTDQRQGAAALRDLLRLYVELAGDSGQRRGADGSMRQVEGLRSVSSAPITRRLPLPGPIAFARGLEVVLTFDEAGFGGSGAFLLGAVLDEFFSRYVSINSFTETVVRTLERGEIMRWPARMGKRPMI